MKLFSVTEVLNPFRNDLSTIPSHILERASIRGIETHLACSAWARGTWVKKLALDVQPYFDSFTMWAQKSVQVFYMIEEEITDEILGFHGRLDFYLKLVDGWEGIVDIKTPAVESPTWKSQLSAYKHLVEKKYKKKDLGAMSLQLHARGGDAKAIHYKHSPADFAAFLSALNAMRYFNG